MREPPGSTAVGGSLTGRPASAADSSWACTKAAAGRPSAAVGQQQHSAADSPARACTSRLQAHTASARLTAHVHGLRHVASRRGPVPHPRPVAAPPAAAGLLLVPGCCGGAVAVAVACVGRRAGGRQQESRLRKRSRRRRAAAAATGHTTSQCAIAGCWPAHGHPRSSRTGRWGGAAGGGSRPGWSRPRAGSLRHVWRGGMQRSAIRGAGPAAGATCRRRWLVFWQQQVRECSPSDAIAAGSLVEMMWSLPAGRIGRRTAWSMSDGRPPLAAACSTGAA